MCRTWNSEDTSSAFANPIGSSIVSSRGRTRTSTSTYSVSGVPRSSRYFYSGTGSGDIRRTGSLRSDEASARETGLDVRPTLRRREDGDCARDTRAGACRSRFAAETWYSGRIRMPTRPRCVRRGDFHGGKSGVGRREDSRTRSAIRTFHLAVGLAVVGSLVGCGSSNANGGGGGITASGTSSRIGLLALNPPARRVVILKKSAEGEDCPGGGAYGDYGKAIRNAIASVPGANILVNVTLSSAESFSIVGVGICTRATGDAGRLE